MKPKIETEIVVSKVKISKYEELHNRLNTKEGMNDSIDWRKQEEGKPDIC